MTTKIAIRVQEERARTFTFTGNIAVPNIGETVMHPRSDGTVLTVQRRTFEYGENRLRVTLDCA
ncbi:MAG TPA: hypothetical protein VMD92_19495 [Acidobacteriaceae bacterium]|nr:hypothetical protein [Acidobacteriaceae bacterium]